VRCGGWALDIESPLPVASGGYMAKAHRLNQGHQRWIL
jgi:hypothetical protein